MSYESESSEETRNNFVSQKIEKIKFEGLIKKVISEPRKLRRNGKATAEIQFYLVAGGIMQGNGIIRVQKHRPLEELGPGQGLPYRSWASWRKLSHGKGASPRTGQKKNTWLLPSSSPAIFCQYVPLARPIWKYNSLWYRVEQGKARTWTWEQTSKWQARWSTLKGRGNSSCLNLV